MDNAVSKIKNILGVIKELQVCIRSENDPVKHAALADQYVKALGHLFSAYRNITHDNLEKIKQASQISNEAGLKAVGYLDMVLDDIEGEFNHKLNLN